MSRAFCDGILLINLCEILKDEKLGRYFPTPSNRIQKIENLNKVFAFCVKNGIRTVCCSPEGSSPVLRHPLSVRLIRIKFPSDIVDANLKLTRGLLLQMYHVFGDKNTEGLKISDQLFHAIDGSNQYLITKNGDVRFRWGKTLNTMIW